MSDSSGRKIKLGLSMRGHGYHQCAWLHSGADSHGPHQFDYYHKLTKIAEGGLFDLVFLADFNRFSTPDVPKGAAGRNSTGGLEPLTLLAALGPATSNIGLVATASTTFNSPYQIARALASLDLISGGRAGWNLVTSFQDEEAKNYGSSALPEKSQRYDRAEEFVNVVAGLWDSFDPDTFVADRKTGIFFDPKKVRMVNHVGKHFSVAGPLTVPRSPQGRPVIFQAGASDDGQELAARTADVVYAAQNTFEDSKAFYTSLKSRMPKYGRDPEHLKILPGILPVIGETQKDAEAKYAALKDLIDPMVGLQYLAGFFGDLSSYPLDGPVPELRTDKQLPTRSEVLLKIARQNNYSIRELFQSAIIGRAHHVVIGTAESIVDVMEKWFVEGAADGFNILPAISPGDVQLFVDTIVPELQRRGLYRTEYEGSTLRANLGLPDIDPGVTLAPRQISREAADAAE